MGADPNRWPRLPDFGLVPGAEYPPGDRNFDAVNGLQYRSCTALSACHPLQKEQSLRPPSEAGYNHPGASEAINCRPSRSGVVAGAANEHASRHNQRRRQRQRLHRTPTHDPSPRTHPPQHPTPRAPPVSLATAMLPSLRHYGTKVYSDLLTLPRAVREQIADDRRRRLPLRAAPRA